MTMERQSIYKECLIQDWSNSMEMWTYIHLCNICENIQEQVLDTCQGGTGRILLTSWREEMTIPDYYVRKFNILNFEYVVKGKLNTKKY